MFDGLKEKLDRFRDDAADAVEDAAEEDSVEEGTAEAASADTPASESAADTAAAADGTDGAAVESGAPEPDESSEDDAGESESDGVSRLKRAKAFATGKVVIEEADLEDPLWELERALIASDVEMGVAEEILGQLRDELVGETRKQVETTAGLVEDALREALLEVIGVGQFDFEERIEAADKPVTIVFTGVNGVGKTTTIAKLSRYLEERGHSSVLANGDTYRAGANEQIREHGEALSRELISHEQGGDPAAVIYDAVEYAEAHDIDVVLGDTAGRLHTSDDLMAQLEKIDRVVDPDLTIFVDEAVAGQDAVSRAREFHDAAPFDGVILTKADADSQGGAAISVAHVTGKPVLFLGTGQGYADLRRFDPGELVGELLE